MSCASVPRTVISPGRHGELLTFVRYLYVYSYTALNFSSNKTTLFSTILGQDWPIKICKSIFKKNSSKTGKNLRKNFLKSMQFTTFSYLPSTQKFGNLLCTSTVHKISNLYPFQLKTITKDSSHQTPKLSASSFAKNTCNEHEEKHLPVVTTCKTSQCKTLLLHFLS